MIQKNPNSTSPINFQKFANVLSTKSCDSFPDLISALNYIRGENRDDLDIIEKLRAIPKGTLESDNIKRSLPAIIWNFNTTGCRKKTCATDSTGFFYFDIDGKESHDFNPDYFCAFWKSVTNTGFGALVQVSGVNTQNFNVAYKEVAKSLDIPFDQNAKDIVRLNILSYDPNIFHNPESEVIDFSHLSDSVDVQEEINEKCQAIDKNTFIKSSECNDTFSKLRYDNLDEKKANVNLIYDCNGVCDLKDNKILYSQVYVPKVIYEGNRYKPLTKIGIQILTLNPEVKLKQFTSFLSHINTSQCQPPMNIVNLKFLSKRLFNNRQSFILFPNKTRRFFFNVQLNLSDKRSLVLSYITREKSAQKKEAIKFALEQLIEIGEPFKLVDVIKKASAARNTVKKYLKEIILENPDINLTMLTTKIFK